MSEVIEFAAFPAIERINSEKDLTAIDNWTFQLRSPSGKGINGSIDAFLKECGITVIPDGAAYDAEQPVVVVLRRYKSPRTGWKSLTFHATRSAIALISKAAAPSKFDRVRANTEAIAQWALGKAKAIKLPEVQWAASDLATH